ncbi:hypothetical protein OIU78_021163 [Salix suchowensis]|nr:hypothetical protein OIU78_021163 [Salix suchowensis]
MVVGHFEFSILGNLIHLWWVENFNSIQHGIFQHGRFKTRLLLKHSISW